MTIDPLALDVQWNRLIHAVNEQAAALQRTSFTPVVRDAGDLSACVFDSRGCMMAQADTGTPGHINSMARCMRYVLREIPLDTMRPGDVFITNDPWESSGHLHDITVVTPVFHPRRPHPVGFFVNCCHVVDIGGRGFGADAREVYEEGLAIPVMHLYRAGEPNRDLERIIGANVREPELSLGDIHAQVVANDVGARRLLDMMEEEGLDDLVPLADAIIERSERAMRDALRRITPGVYRNEVFSDGFDEPVRIAVAVTVGDGHVLVDFTGTSPESPHGINVVLNYTHAYTTYAFKCAVSPDVPNNEGSFRPIAITAPEGCILNARRPRAVAARHVLGHFIPAAIHGALAGVVPVMAEGAANIWAVQIQGDEGPEGRRPFTALFFTAGGTGARPRQDGLSSTAFPSGIRGVPVEIIETTAPLVVERKELRTDSGGPGRQRGGLGHSITIASVTGAPLALSAMYDRFDHPARGLEGGGAGEPGALEVGGQRQRPKGRIGIPAGRSFTLHLPGGGGYGDPYERDPERVCEDVRLGLVSPRAAREQYGVVLTEKGEVDAEETARLRSARREQA